MKTAGRIIKQAIKYLLNTIVSIIALTGIFSSSAHANISAKPTTIQQQIDDVRLRLLESDKRVNECRPIVESENSKTSIAQWYNWGNFPNYWRNY